ncbi:hypothetical protein H6F95_08055 [Cyanobacteria bacterium FACHB-471]|nr:hypothetical protein [Cyanobacteria bacterium FACHB-471]
MRCERAIAVVETIAGEGRPPLYSPQRSQLGLWNSIVWKQMSVGDRHFYLLQLLPSAMTYGS